MSLDEAVDIVHLILRIATSVRLVAMPWIDEENCQFLVRKAASHRRSRTQYNAIASDLFATD